MLKVCVTRCVLGLFILPQNWQLELNTVTKESISKSCHQQLRPVIFLRTYYKAAKQTLLSASPETPPTFLPSFIYNKEKQSPGESAEEEATGGFGRADSLVQRLFLYLPEPQPA